MVKLTPAQTRVLDLAAAGFSLNETAEVLGCAPSTVKKLRERVFRRLGVRNMPHAVALGYDLGILGAPAVSPNGPTTAPDGKGPE